MSTLSSQEYVFDPRPHYPLLVTAKRYWDPESAYLDDTSAYTLVFLHGVGFHKENWEPTIDDLYTLSKGGKGEEKLRIRELWSIDCPNHGDAAVLNEKTLLYGYGDIFGWEEYARSVHLFLSGLGKGVDVDFSKRRLVGIGHSMGAISVLLSSNYFPQIRYEAVVLCDPMTFDIRRAGGGVVLSEGSKGRRDIWSSKEDAYATLKSRPAWEIWDDRVLRLYAEKGMRSLPTAYYPDKTQGVTLACSRVQETACYRDSLGCIRVYDHFRDFVARQPTHIIYGAIDDYVPAELKEDVIANAIGGVENLASLARLPGAGHLVVQVNPKGLAKCLFDALIMTQNIGQIRSRL